jgi:hypothetical protein
MTFLWFVFIVWLAIMCIAFVRGLVYRNHRYIPVSGLNTLNSEIGESNEFID